MLQPPVKNEFFDALHDGDTAQVAALLECGADPNQEGRNGMVPLISAAQGGDVDIVILLLDHGAEINAKNSQRFNALNAAIERDNINVVRVLIERGAPLDDRLSRGNTALHQAVHKRDAEIVQLLVDGLADIGKVNDGCTPYELALSQGMDEIAQILEAAPDRQAQIRQERAEAQRFQEMHERTARNQALLKARPQMRLKP